MLNEPNRAKVGCAHSSYQAKQPDETVEPLCKDQIR